MKQLIKDKADNMRNSYRYYSVPPLVAWLFIVGWCQLSFWQGVAAFFIWPYYFGCKIAGVM